MNQFEKTHLIMFINIKVKEAVKLSVACTTFFFKTVLALIIKYNVII